MRLSPDRALWASAAVLVVLAGIRWSRALPDVAPDAIEWGAHATAASDSMRDLGAEADELFESNPFRLTREPAAVPFGADASGAPPPAAPAAPPQPPRPTLVLRGTVGGPPWRAVIEGLPGRDAGALVSRGDTVSGIRVRSVSRDSVVLQGMDTTWRLSVHRAWQ